MKFKMNDLEWEIKYATADEVKAVFNDTNPDSYYYGSTTMSTQEVLINKEASKEKQRETLYHELMHCYIYCYLCDGLEFDEEGICNISAKSHNMIHRIADEFFNQIDLERLEDAPLVDFVVVNAKK